MSTKELSVIVEKTETGEKQKGIIVQYRSRSHYKVILSNIFGDRLQWWSGDKRGFSGGLDISRSWKNIKTMFEVQGYFKAWCDYKIYPAQPEKKKSTFKNIEL